VTTRNEFSSADIGSPSVKGGSAYDNTTGTWTLLAGGSGTGGNSDQFQFDYQPLAGNQTLITQVQGLTATSTSAEAGLMFRNSNAANAAMASLAITASNGVVFQWRSGDGSAASSVTVAGVSAPEWLELTRVGNVFSAYHSSDGSTWAQVGTSQTLSIASTADAGLAAASYNTASATTANFSNFSITVPGITDTDIGTPPFAGNAIYNGSGWAVSGSGGDIWNSADTFNFVNQPFNGSGSVIAEVDTMQSTAGYAKAGVMIRESTAAGARYADVIVYPAGNVFFQWRSTTGGSCGTAQTNGITAPVWLKVTRTGNSFSGYYSTDDITWNQIGGSVSIAMNGSALSGLAVASNNNSLSNTAVFSNVWFDAVDPTLATAASASPATVSGNTTALSVLGAYVGGESNLTYSWQETAGPAGVSFSNTGTNLAKQCTALFPAAGTYQLTVVIIDPSSPNSVSSTVTVAVNQTATALQISPATAQVATNSTTPFSAVLVDQFGNAMPNQPTVSWSLGAGYGSVNGSGGLHGPVVYSIGNGSSDCIDF
jgi:regulation of enolase protein 1 (concanavalin A-like superfamily)